MFGTNPYQFTRLAKALDDLAARIDDEIFVQRGNTNYEFLHCKSVAFMPHEEVLGKIKGAKCLVLQGGAGSISDGIRLGKPIVVVPRYPELHESPDHQEHLVRKLDEMGCVTAVLDVKDLEQKIREAMSKRLVRPPSNNIPGLISAYLKTLK